MTPGEWTGIGVLTCVVITGIYNIIKLIIKASRADDLEKERDYLRNLIDEKNRAVRRMK